MTSQSPAYSSEVVPKANTANSDEAEDPILKQEPLEVYDPASEREQEEAANAKPITEKVENLQKEVTRRVVSLSDEIDSFFGEKRTDDEANKSTLRLVQANYFSERNPQSSDFQVNLNLRFRNLERFGAEVQESIENFFRSAAPKKTEKDKKTPTDGLGSNPQKPEEPWYFNWENRVGVRWPLDVSSAFRWRKNFPGDVYVHRFYQQIGWATQDEWQSVTSLSSDKDLGPKTLFRFSNEFDWALTYQQYKTIHGPSVLHTIGPRDSVSIDLRGITGLVDNAWYLNVANLGVNYRRQAEVKWLFFELNPQITLARTQNFRRDFNVTVRFEIAMGNM